MSFFQKIKEAFIKNEDKDQYLTGLDRSKKGFGDRIRDLSNNFHGVNDELLEEIMMILLESDVGIHTAQKIVNQFELRANEIKHYDSMEDYFIQILYDFYEADSDSYIHYNPDGPTMIFMVGVNGAGKTTTCAKLIQYYQKQGKKVAVIAADTFRAGAVDQIAVWADRLNVPCVKGKPKQDPASVIMDGAQFALDNDIDIIFADTAGRLQNKKNLMDELSKMNRVVQKVIHNAPHEVWLVLDATTGQNGITQAQLFMEATDVSGIILTKMDGTAKGGVVLAIRDVLHLPVRFLGLGEKPEDLKPFDINAYLIGITKGMEV